MKQEEYLDHLLDEQNYRGFWQLVEDHEIAGSLAAAERLAQLKEIAVPVDFARRLEGSVRARARSRSLPIQHGTLPSNSRMVLIPGRRRSANVRRSSKRHSWMVLLGTAAALVLSFASVLAFSTQSLPGDPLYGLKQAGNQLMLTFANGPQSRASAELNLLQSALVDLRTVVTAQRDDGAIQLALQTVAARTDDCHQAIAAIPAGPQRDGAQQNFDSLLVEEEQTVRQFLSQVDWPTRLLFTHQLGVLGDSVPTVTHVSVRAQTNGTLLITLTGAHFAPQAKLVIDGRPTGMVSQENAGQLIATINSWEAPPGSHAFGVLNPDGTAAQLILKGDDDHDNPGGQPNQYGTPDGDRDADDD